MTLFGDEYDGPRVEREVQGGVHRSVRGSQPLRGHQDEPVRHDGHAQPTAFLHLTHTPTCPHSGRDYGYPIYWARYGGSGVSGLEPLATVAKLFELVLRHRERDRECAKWVLDGDGLAVTKRGEA